MINSLKKLSAKISKLGFNPEADFLDYRVKKLSKMNLLTNSFQDENFEISDMFEGPLSAELLDELILLVQDYYYSMEHLQGLILGLRSSYGMIKNSMSDSFQDERIFSARRKADIEDIDVKDLIEEALDQIPDGHHMWYEKSLSYIKEILGVSESDYSLILFMKVLAATSNNASPKGNFTLAIKALRQHIKGEDLSGFYPVVAKNLERAFSGEELSGPKVQAFYKNLSGDQDAVTVDQHMWEIIYGKKRGTPLRQRYAVMIIAKVAKEIGLTNAQTQAALWAANHFRNNRVPGDYLSEIKKRQGDLIDIFSKLKSDRGI